MLLFCVTASSQRFWGRH